MKSFVFKGTLKSSDNKRQQVIDINMPQNGLSIRGLTKSILEVDKNLVPDDNGVYVLESEDKCYVGQSKNLRDRLKNHFANNKINHSRIFFLHKKDDIRGYLDYMEKRLFKSMSDEGYDLANGTNLDPELDRLDIEEKRLVDTWINEFLTFLPILGFRKEAIKQSVVELSNGLKKEEKIISQIKTEDDIYTRDKLKELIKKCSYEEIIRLGVLTSTFRIDKEYFENKLSKKETEYLINDFGEKLYYELDYDHAAIKRKIKQLKPLALSLSVDGKAFIEGEDYTRDRLKELIKRCHYEDIVNGGILTSTFRISKEPLKNENTKKPPTYIINNFGETIYYELDHDRVTLKRKVKQIESLLSKLDIVNQHLSGSNGDKNTRDTLRELIKQCSFEKLEKSGIITTTFDIKRAPFVNKFTERPAESLVNNFGETIYYILHFDSKTLERKIKQLSQLFNSIRTK